MNRYLAIVFLAAFALIATGCSKKESTAPAAGTSPTASSAPLPVRIAANFDFNDVSVTTSGPRLLRLGFTIHNISKDPVLCDPGVFTLTLADGTEIKADTSAEDKCVPDTVDPGATGKAVMYFNLPAGYTGVVTLSMISNDAIIGKGNTTIK